jgi:hypothetical protein
LIRDARAFGDGMHQAACSTRAVPRLVALVLHEAGAMRRVQATNRECLTQGSTI